MDKQFKENIIKSFSLVKTDIMALQSKMTELSQAQQRIMEYVDKLKEKDAKLSQKMSKISSKKPAVKTQVKTIVKKAKKVFVASKAGKRVHDSTCPFAKNIKPKSKIVFQSKTKALNEGYKACECLKK